MKCVLLVALLAVIGAASAGTSLKNPIDDLVKAALEYVRYLLKTNEPLELPPLPSIDVSDDVNKIYLTTNVSNVYVSDADQFQVISLNNNILAMTADFSVFLPTLNLNGDYSVTGTAFDKDVEGSGTFKLAVQSLTVDGHVQLKLESGYVQMAALSFNYTVDNVQFSEEGLEVEGLSPQQLDDLFNSAVLKFFQDNESEVCSNVATFVINNANALMKGKTLADIINWLKNIVNPTTAPSVI